ncbi:hypothetical protein TNCV_1354061 [Trichonephila clavipes]|nr:hypothetical protein TNCV_1354061 [Trichonephila clavipes]
MRNKLLTHTLTGSLSTEAESPRFESVSLVMTRIPERDHLPNRSIPSLHLHWSLKRGQKAGHETGKKKLSRVRHGNCQKNDVIESVL